MAAGSCTRLKVLKQTGMSFLAILTCVLRVRCSPLAPVSTVERRATRLRIFTEHTWASAMTDLRTFTAAWRGSDNPPPGGLRWHMTMGKGEMHGILKNSWLWLEKMSRRGLLCRSSTEKFSGSAGGDNFNAGLVRSAQTVLVTGAHAATLSLEVGTPYKKFRRRVCYQTGTDAARPGDAEADQTQRLVRPGNPGSDVNHLRWLAFVRQTIWVGTVNRTH